MNMTKISQNLATVVQVTLLWTSQGADLEHNSHAHQSICDSLQVPLWLEYWTPSQKAVRKVIRPSPEIPATLSYTSLQLSVILFTLHVVSRARKVR